MPDVPDDEAPTNRLSKWLRCTAVGCNGKGYLIEVEPVSKHATAFTCAACKGVGMVLVPKSDQ